MSKSITSDELLKMANKTRLRNSEVIDILVGMEVLRRREFVGWVNSGRITPRRAAEELAALRMAILVMTQQYVGPEKPLTTSWMEGEK